MKKIIRTGVAVTALLASFGMFSAQALDLADAYKETLAAQHIVTQGPQGSEDLIHITMLCWPGREQIAMLHTYNDPPPTKVFDNMYFVGRGSVGSWAIKTSQGIILIDTLDNPQEADDYIIGGLKKLGLDPMTIKYVIVTHGHGDHYGGAAELQAKIPGVHVLMSQADYDLATKTAANPKGPFKGVPAPKPDMVVTDGQKLTLGDETLTLYITPGHTEGTLSMLIPVMDHGTPHVMGLFGGSTFPANQKSVEEFSASLARFRQIQTAANVSGRMSNHPQWDNSIQKLQQINANPTGPNPYLETPLDMQRYADIQDHCIKATADQIP